MRTLEEKKILVNAICEYMPYEPCIANEDIDSGFPIRIHIGDLRLSRFIEGYGLDSEIYGEYKADKTIIYLRPMDSITKEEIEEFEELFPSYSISIERMCVYHSKRGDFNLEVIDWLRAHLFDYRGLIKKGIAKPIGTEKKFEG